MKVRSIYEFSEAIDRCTSLRQHELKNLSAQFLNRKATQQTMQKAALLLCYAHWEGGVKDVATAYLQHVVQQRKRRGELKSNFLALESVGAFRAAANSNNILLHVQALDHIRFNLDHRLSLPNAQLIDTESNLSSKVLQNILRTIGLEASWADFELKQHFIDYTLLKTRNEIAHTGQVLDQGDVEVRPIAEVTLELLRHFKTIVQNAAALKSYLH